MRIIFIDPLFSEQAEESAGYSLSLLQLAAYLRDNGYQDVYVINMNYELAVAENKDNIIQRSYEIIEKYTPDIIAFTSFTHTVPYVAELSKMCKSKINAPVILGGMYPSQYVEKTFELTNGDYIIKGEGEATLLELAKFLNGDINKDISEIQGLSYREGKTIRHNPDRKLIPDIDELPCAAYDLLPFNEVKNITMALSRGCSMNCGYCSLKMFWKYQRKKSIQSVVKEIKFIKEKYKPETFFFADECVNIDLLWFGELLQKLKRLDVKWWCMARIDALNAKLLQDMKKAGCIGVMHGIESGSARIRDFIGKTNRKNKQITNEQILELLKYERTLGIKQQCGFMIGMPTETEEEMSMTIEMIFKIKNLGAIICFYILHPIINSRMHNEYKDKIINVSEYPEWQKIINSSLGIYQLESFQKTFYSDFYQKYKNYYDQYIIYDPEIGLDKFKDILNDYLERDMLCRASS